MGTCDPRAVRRSSRRSGDKPKVEDGQCTGDGAAANECSAANTSRRCALSQPPSGLLVRRPAISTVSARIPGDATTGRQRCFPPPVQTSRSVPAKLLVPHRGALVSRSAGNPVGRRHPRSKWCGADRNPPWRCDSGRLNSVKICGVRNDKQVLITHQPAGNMAGIDSAHSSIHPVRLRRVLSRARSSGLAAASDAFPPISSERHRTTPMIPCSL